VAFVCAGLGGAACCGPGTGGAADGAARPLMGVLGGIGGGSFGFAEPGMGGRGLSPLGLLCPGGRDWLEPWGPAGRPDSFEDRGGYCCDAGGSWD
jgi:hypothetical protein